jgi:hypothetical protein
MIFHGTHVANTIIVDVPLPYMEVRITQCGKANNTIIGLNDQTVTISDFIGNYRPPDHS